MLYYKTFQNQNSNEWVVFIHGAGGSSTTFFKQIKDFRKSFNILLVDLRGHGNSYNKKDIKPIHRYSFEKVSDDVLEVLDHLNIREAHFLGISLGTIIIRTICDKYPERVKSMVLGGAITRLHITSRFLLKMANFIKYIIPFNILYKLFAFVVMPNKSHKESRNIFIREARKLCHREFLRWFVLTKDINPLLKYFKDKPLTIPTLYIMGDEDYLFLHTLKNDIVDHQNSELYIIDNCGHVCNIEKPKEFNHKAINFLKNQSYQANAI